MSTKKRVHELAKEYAMTGQGLASKLQSLGFPEIKGPNSTLDDTQLLIVEGTLQANGIYRAAAQPKDLVEDAAEVPGLIKKRKKKITSLSDFDRDEPERAAAPQAPVPAAPAAPELAPEAAPQLAPQAAPAPATEAAPPARPARKEVAGAPEPTPEPAAPSAALPQPQAPAPAPVEPEPEPVYRPEPEALAESPADELPAAPASAHALPATPVGPDDAPPLPVASEPMVRPAPPRRAGKVVGFVDLSKVTKVVAPKRPDARRLRSKDDVTPNVQPTLGHDKKKALVRGDQASRGQLTATQLREKEAGRFLRRKGAPQQGAPSRSGGGQRARGFDAGASPHSGGEAKVDAPVTLKKLAEALSIKTNQLLGKALEQKLGMLNQNSVLDDDTAVLLALEFGVALKVQHEVRAETALLDALIKKRTAVEEHELIVRPPSVAFLGHVDHGKTTLIDRIRDSQIAQGETGGITQHIGAYQVSTKSGHPLTIIDTPGHEAFTAMRARGADAVDIVVLVVAADDGVMASTVEALQHARAASKIVVVALNKCDKPGANPKRVKEQLSKEGLIPEEWGGPTAMLEVSALNGQGVDELLERVFLESEVLELKSHSIGPASGVVLEAEVEEGKGRVAHLLVKDGTLNKGDVILAGEGFGRVRSMYDDRGREIDSAGPSTPVQVTGLSELPSVGEPFHVITKLEQAREVAEERRKKNRLMSMAERKQITAENILQAVADQSKKIIHVILRADVQGSLQALEQQIKGLVHPEVDVKLLSAGLGTVTESDVNLAATSGGTVMAFRVGTNSEAREAAERGNVEIRPYEIIYEMFDDLRLMMEGTLAPEMTQQITGHIEVRAIFKSSKFGNIAGCHVLDGAVTRDNKVRVQRGNKTVHEGTLKGLRREKDDVREVRAGFDCGVTVADFDLFEVGDVIEGYKIVAVKRKLARA